MCRRIVRENGSADELRRKLDKEVLEPQMLGVLLKEVIVYRQEDFQPLMDALIKYAKG